MGEKDIRDKLRSLGGLAGAPPPPPDAPRPSAADLSGLLTRRARITEDIHATAVHLAGHLGLPADSEAAFLVELADHLIAQPPTTPSWWSIDDLDPVRATLERTRKAHRDLDVLHGQIFDLAGAEWRSLPVVKLEGAFGEDGLRLERPDTLTAQNIGEHRRLIADIDRFAASLRRFALTLDAALRCELEALTVGAIHRLTAALLTMAERPPPVTRWADLDGPRVARATYEATVADLDAEADLRKEVARHFTEGIAEVDMPSLMVEVRGDADEAAAKLEDLTRPEMRPASGEAIYAATEWFEIRRAIDAGAFGRQAMLGPMAEFPLDRTAIDEALGAMEDLHGALGDQIDSARIREMIEYHGFEDPIFVGVARAIESEVSVFSRYCTKLGYIGLDDLRLADLEEWRESAEANLDKLTGAVDALGDAAGDRPLGELVLLLQLRARIATAEERLAEDRGEAEALLGPLPDDPLPSQWEQMAAGITWVGELREVYGGPLPVDAVERVHGIDEIDDAARLRGLLRELHVVQGELDAIGRARAADETDPGEHESGSTPTDGHLDGDGPGAHPQPG